MSWTISYAHSAQKDAKKLDAQTKRKIRAYLHERIAPLDDPRQFGKPLKGQLSELWRYRVGNYRIICDINDRELIVLVLRLSHRKDVYNKPL